MSQSTDLVSFINQILRDQMRLAAGQPLRPHNDLTRGPATQIEGERMEALTKARAEFHQCQSEDCENEAVWPSRYCEECAAEIGVGA